MKISAFRRMPHRELLADFEQRYESVWVTRPQWELADARRVGQHYPSAASGASIRPSARTSPNSRMSTSAKDDCGESNHAHQRPGLDEHRARASTRYWMTWSARCRSVSGIVKPSALAVLRLINSSNLVGCSTGRSLGFAPFKIRST
jgi:hypothetical protein